MGDMSSSVYLRLPVPLQNLALSCYAGWRNGLRYGKEFRSALSAAMENEWASEDVIGAKQDEALRRMIRWSYATVPYYRRVFDERALRPQDVQTRADLYRLPTLRKEDIRRLGKELCSRGYRDRVAGVTTSGTSGTPLLVKVGTEAIGTERAIVWRQRARVGVRRGDPFVSFIGRMIVPLNARKPPYWRRNHAEGQTIFSLWHLSESTADAYLEAYNQARPVFVQGYSSFLNVFARFALERGFKLIRPAAVFTSSETLEETARANIEAAFRAPVMDHYGAAEHVAAVSQCERGGYHLDPELGVIEVVDGNIVATSLTNFAMPLIRYEIGDRIVELNRFCACGRRLKLFGQPAGRKDDIIIGKDGREIAQVGYVLKAGGPDVVESQIVQEVPGEIRVQVVGRSSFSLDAYREGIERRLEGLVAVRVERVDKIPRDKSGKLRRVVSTIASRKR